jgi:drug/metabolite transporter (DMT)-like permease
MPHTLKSESIVSMQLLLAAVTLLPFFIFNGISEHQFSAGPILAVIALGVFGSGIAYLWNFKVMQLAGSAIASSVTYLTPVVAIIVGIIFLGEKVTWYEPVGGLIVLFGAALAQGRISLGKGESNR